VGNCSSCSTWRVDWLNKTRRSLHWSSVYEVNLERGHFCNYCKEKLSSITFSAKQKSRDMVRFISVSVGNKMQHNRVKPVLNGISRVQNIFLLKPGFRLIKEYYDRHSIRKYFRLRQVLLYFSSVVLVTAYYWTNGHAPRIGLSGIILHIVACGPVAKQWLCKQRPLLGNGRKENREMVLSTWYKRQSCDAKIELFAGMFSVRSMPRKRGGAAITRQFWDVK
jgi:hypothetical protein